MSGFELPADAGCVACSHGSLLAMFPDEILYPKRSISLKWPEETYVRSFCVCVSNRVEGYIVRMKTRASKTWVQSAN